MPWQRNPNLPPRWLQAAEAISHEAPTQGGARIHGVMVGRAAYNNPWHCLADADRVVFGEPANAAASRREVR